MLLAWEASIRQELYALLDFISIARKAHSMYTLEDDHETPSNLRRDMLPDNTVIDGETGLPYAAVPTPADLHASTLPLQPDPVHQTRLGRVWQRLTTPGKNSNGKKHEGFAALTIACIAVFFTALDQTVVVTALPDMIVDLNISITQLDHAAWIVSAYLLGFVVAMPLMGRISDIYGRRRIFLLCLAIFGVSSIFCGLAPWLGRILPLSFLESMGVPVASSGLLWIIVARLIQAIGGGALVPLAMAIASDFYGQEQRGMALGIVGAVTEIGGVLGPLYGAVVVESLGWQYIFYLNVPLVIGLLIAAWFMIPRGQRLQEGTDWVGAILLAVALTCLSLGLAQQGSTLNAGTVDSGAPQNNWVILLLAVVVFGLFVVVERKARWPLIDLRFFQRLTFNAASLVSLLAGAALIIAMADIPIYVETVLQGGVMDSGLALLRLTVMIPIGALLGGWLSARFTCRLVGIIGLLCTALGFFLMSRWPLPVGWLEMTIGTAIAGFGFGLVIAPISSTAINAVRPSQAGVSSAIVTALRMVGMTLGLALLTSWALSHFQRLVSGYPSLPAEPTQEQFAAWSLGYAVHLIQSAHIVYSNVFFIAMLICLIAIVPACFLWGKQRPIGEAVDDAPTMPLGLGAVNDDHTIASPSRLPAFLRRSNWRQPQNKRVVILASVALIALIFGGVAFAATWISRGTGNELSPGTPTNNNPSVVSGPRRALIGLDKDALTSVFATQLNTEDGTISDLSVAPQEDDRLLLNLTLNMDIGGVPRALPIEMDTTVSMDEEQNLHLTILHLKRDGLEADEATVADMQEALDSMMADAVMPALREQFAGVTLLGVETSTEFSCAQGTPMLVLLVEAPPVENVPAQPTPVPFCVTGAIDIDSLLPQE